MKVHIDNTPGCLFLDVEHFWVLRLASIGLDRIGQVSGETQLCLDEMGKIEEEGE